jgi:hypothetical protein
LAKFSCEGELVFRSGEISFGSTTVGSHEEVRPNGTELYVHGLGSCSTNTHVLGFHCADSHCGVSWIASEREIDKGIPSGMDVSLTLFLDDTWELVADHLETNHQFKFDETKRYFLYLHLDWKDRQNQLSPPSTDRKSKDPTKKYIDHGTVKSYVSAIMDLYNLQVMNNTNSNPNPNTKVSHFF